MIKKIRSVKQICPWGSLMVIFAHPDDECLQSAGTLALAAHENIDTHVVIITRGERGNKKRELDLGLSSIRKKELAAAAKILKVKKLTQFSFLDGFVAQSEKKLSVTIMHFLKKQKPSVVITHDPSGGSGHPDHRAISRAAQGAVMNLPFKIKLFFSVYGGARRKSLALQIPEVIRRMPQSTHKILVSSVCDERSWAMFAHVSQLAPGTTLADIFRLNTIFDTEYLNEPKLEYNIFHENHRKL